MKRHIAIICCFLFVLCSTAQTRKRHFRQKEIGLFGGASYYIGDINPRKHFIPSHLAGGVFFRYSTNYRFAFRVGANYGMVSASDATSKEPDQLERNLSFRSRIFDGHGIAEFHFVDYRLGNEKHYMTMYLFAGLGGCYMNPQMKIDDKYENLNSKNTEGQKKTYSSIQMTIPFGIGYKWSVTDRLGFGIEWAPRKMFTDYLDDVSNAYANFSTALNPNAGTPGNMRGNPRSKDWYFFYGFTLNFRLLNKQSCYNVGSGG